MTILSKTLTGKRYSTDYVYHCLYMSWCELNELPLVSWGESELGPRPQNQVLVTMKEPFAL